MTLHEKEEDGPVLKLNVEINQYWSLLSQHTRLLELRNVPRRLHSYCCLSLFLFYVYPQRFLSEELLIPYLNLGKVLQNFM